MRILHTGDAAMVEWVLYRSLDPLAFTFLKPS